MNTTKLRLELILRAYKEGDRWTWRLRENGEIVSGSVRQLYSRRVDCARGAEVGAGLEGVCDALAGEPSRTGALDGKALRPHSNGVEPVGVRLRDERKTR